MRNYVIINGKKSDYVRGLIIQELPPITLPPIRTEIIEIEGRDGDIVEKLGYQAYDKEFTIGLYGDYDVNQIISYFAQSGSIIFSNEPDKYYQFEMISQIDLERLIRYKTATITLHVQPFKYSAINEYYDYVGGIIPFNIYSDQRNGIDLISSGDISLFGTATSYTTFIVPINVLLNSGTTSIKINAVGSGLISVGLYDGTSYFGGSKYNVEAGEIIINGSLDTFTSFTQLHITVESGQILSLRFSMFLLKINVWNGGNIESVPKYTIQCSGDAQITINNRNSFYISLPENYSTIILDVGNLYAYYNSINMNRFVSGDYNDLMLDVGQNQIEINGDITQIIIERYERWL